MLHEFLARMVKDELCWLRRPNWTEQYNVDLMTGTRAVKVDAKARSVELADGRKGAL